MLPLPIGLCCGCMCRCPLLTPPLLCQDRTTKRCVLLCLPLNVWLHVINDGHRRCCCCCARAWTWWARKAGRHYLPTKFNCRVVLSAAAAEGIDRKSISFLVLPLLLPLPLPSSSFFIRCTPSMFWVLLCCSSAAAAAAAGPLSPIDSKAIFSTRFILSLSSFPAPAVIMISVS